jgi:hypothetical protein
MRVQQFDPSAPKLADNTERGLPPSIKAEEENSRMSVENSEPQARLYTNRRLQVQKSPQIVKAVKDCSVTLLENSDVNVFNLFLHALFSRTNAHNRASVRRCLKWLGTWMDRMPKEEIDIAKSVGSSSSSIGSPPKTSERKNSTISTKVSNDSETLLKRAKRRVSETSSFWGRLLGRSDSISTRPVR